MNNFFLKGKLYQIKLQNYLFSFDANGNEIPISFNFISPKKMDKKYYYIDWKNNNIPTFSLNNEEILLCLDEAPKIILYFNKNGTKHIGGKTIGFLYCKAVVIPWYNYIYEENTEYTLSKHIKLLEV